MVILLGLDLGVFHRRARKVSFRESLLWTGVWVCLALIFAMGLKSFRGPKDSIQFLTGYLIELSLSMDNMFVIALIFAYFQVPSQHQHRVLFWGILGALLMRGLMIAAGGWLIGRLNWILYVFGVLIVISGIKMLLFKTEVSPEKNLVVRLARKFFPVAPYFDGEKFRTQWNGRMALTPLALALVMVETKDASAKALEPSPALLMRSPPHCNPMGRRRRARSARSGGMGAPIFSSGVPSGRLAAGS